jgi:hypothetical protein
MSEHWLALANLLSLNPIYMDRMQGKTVFFNCDNLDSNGQHPNTSVQRCRFTQNSVLFVLLKAK